MGLMLQSYIVTLLHCDIVPPCPKSAKSNLRGPKISDSSIVYYGSFKLGDFVLKIASIGDRKFGSARKMLYLCSVESDHLNKAGCRPPDVAGRK